MSKRILFRQSKFNKFYEMYRLARYNVPNFSTKKEYVIILRRTNSGRKNLAIFHEAKKVEIYFTYNTFFSYFC